MSLERAPLVAKNIPPRFKCATDRGIDFRGPGELGASAYRSRSAKQHGSYPGMEWLMARGRIPALQKQVPFISFWPHRHGLCLLCHPIIRPSSAWLVGIVGRGGNRLVARLSKRASSFGRHDRGAYRTDYSLFRLGTPGTQSRTVSRSFFPLTLGHKPESRIQNSVMGQFLRQNSVVRCEHPESTVPRAGTILDPGI